ncbi:hypothetical protein SRABI128_06467 [Microbacterium sp. Bi128]|nr:hypothetical protein SRABI128_06467 [Microbacterium sp. Bi128]
MHRLGANPDVHLGGPQDVSGRHERQLHATAKVKGNIKPDDFESVEGRDGVRSRVEGQGGIMRG